MFSDSCVKRIFLKAGCEGIRDVVDGVVASAEAMSYFQILSQR